MQIRKTSAQEGPAEEQRTKWSLTAAAFSVTRACSPNPSRGPRYLGRCLVGPSRVPGHRDLSSGLHPHALLLLSLLLLQDRARERAQGVRGSAHTARPARPGSARGLPAATTVKNGARVRCLTRHETTRNGLGPRGTPRRGMAPGERPAGQTRAPRGPARRNAARPLGAGQTHRHCVEHRRVAGRCAGERGPPTTGRHAPWAGRLPELRAAAPLCSARAGLSSPGERGDTPPSPGGARRGTVLTAAAPGPPAAPTARGVSVPAACRHRRCPEGGRREPPLSAHSTRLPAAPWGAGPGDPRPHCGPAAPSRTPAARRPNNAAHSAEPPGGARRTATRDYS